MRSKLLIPLLLAAFTGCRSTISVRELQLSPPTLMVAQKSPLPLSLIVDAQKVPATLSVLVANEDRGGKLGDTQVFVERDLKRAFENYFSWVEAVPLGKKSDQAGLEVDVRIDRVEIVVVGGGMGFAEMTWSLGMRQTGSNEYLFSYAGKSKSEPTQSPDFALRSALENAIADLFHAYTEKDVHATVLKLGVPG